MPNKLTRDSELEIETAFISSDDLAFSFPLGLVGGLFRGEVLFHAKTDGSAASMYPKRPIPKLFLSLRHGNRLL